VKTVTLAAISVVVIVVAVIGAFIGIIAYHEAQLEYSIIYIQKCEQVQYEYQKYQKFPSGDIPNKYASEGLDNPEDKKNYLVSQCVGKVSDEKLEEITFRVDEEIEKEIQMKSFQAEETPSSSEIQNQTSKKYMKKELSFLMWQPENWERQAISPHPFDPELVVYSMIESSTFDEDQPTTIAVIIDDLEGQTLEQYNEAQWNKYGDILSTVGKVEFLEAGQDITAGEKDIWYEYTYDIQLGPSMFNPVSIDVRLKGMDVIVGHMDDVYTITYLTSEKNYGKHYEEFLDILDTFKFL